jgi:hypothetical protein
VVIAVARRHGGRRGRLDAVCMFAAACEFLQRELHELPFLACVDMQMNGEVLKRITWLTPMCKYEEGGILDGVDGRGSTRGQRD